MEVRLIPMSRKDPEMKNKTIKEIQQDFFENYIKKKSGTYHFKKGINAPKETLLLFQFEGQIIASAKLDNIIRYPKPDTEGYRGEYVLKKSTLNVFNPIAREELKKYSNNFNGFKQGPQFLDITDYSAFLERTTATIDDSVKKILEVLEIPSNKIKEYKVRLMMKNDSGGNPLTIYKEKHDLSDWIGWKYGNNQLNRPKVICFVNNYDIGKDYWLYVGTFEVSKKDNFDNLKKCVGYNLKQVGNIKDIGTLNIFFKNEQQQIIRKLENIINDISIPYLEFNETRVYSKEDWLKVLANEEKLGKDRALDILKFVYLSKDHMINCGKISEYMNIDKAGINSTISSFGKRVLNLLSLPEVKGTNGQNRRWNIPFKTNLSRKKDNIFIWELRPELIAAIEEKYNWKEKYNREQGFNKLERYKRYSRKEIQDIFLPYANISQNSKSWKSSNIIPVPNTISDYIFIVTKKSITDSGILTWTSEPNQKLDDKQIQTFINHDHNKSNIYLFLRENNNNAYSYLGKLAYVTHESKKESPVHIKWQILNWDSSIGEISLDDSIHSNEEIKQKIKENTIDVAAIDSKEFTVNLVVTPNSYTKVERKIKKTEEIINFSKNFAEDAEKNTKIGNKGEDIVVDFEKKHLNSIGRYDLAEQVIATRNYAGNAERFDVLSFEDDGTKKYIEVKTTTGGINNPFNISENEVTFSEIYKNNYYLYRLYNFDKKTKKTDLTIIKGALNRDMLTPTKYVCNISKSAVIK